MNGKLPHLQIPLVLKTLEGKRGPKEKIRDVSLGKREQRKWVMICFIHQRK